MGYCLYGNDISDTTSPFEAGLGWVTKFTKQFVNSEALAAQKEQGVSRKLVGFKMIDKAIPRAHYTVAEASGNAVGEVTSGTLSPVLNIGIGMGYVPLAYSQPGSEIYIQVRDKLQKAEVVKPPFV
jgi:aminomethyltransferase